ncbi:hypothetical protein MPER_00415 [Moniliophthora perniciosa FA553]|nr:hypothetical protein MPER_00415 [Moniliophthora perniciosa FA553]
MTWKARLSVRSELDELVVVSSKDWSHSTPRNSSITTILLSQLPQKRHWVLVGLQISSSGAWIVKTARGAICDKDAIARALASGQISGYAGDMWDVQPAPKDHVWRTMKNLSVAVMEWLPITRKPLLMPKRYAAGTKSILEN